MTSASDDRERSLARQPASGPERTRRLTLIAGSGMTALAAIPGAAIAAATGDWHPLIPAMVMPVITAVTWLAAPLLHSSGLLVHGGHAKQGHIGAGATVESGAVIEPGARVGMGATVKSGVVVKRGAVVGMGSTVEEGAIIEENVLIGWGATVRAGAHLKAGAQLGAGSTVERGAVVEENTRVSPGSVVASLSRGMPAPSLAERTAAATDPRDARIDALCDRLEAELEQIPPAMQELLSRPKETAATVRRTCHSLLKRERELRREANPADQERLNGEVAALEARLAAEKDEVTRRQLQGTLAAIEEHRRQRELLLRDANRLEAEQSRLVWTMEGLITQVVRLRASEVGASGAATAELDQGLAKLRDEVGAVSTALEHVNALELAGGPYEPASETRGRSGARETDRG